MTYLGLDLLAVAPQRDAPPSHEWEWPRQRLDTLTGRIYEDPLTTAGRITRTFPWLARGRTEIQAVRDFLLARKGRRIPFWLPTWQEDLTLTTTAAAGTSILTIAACGYTSYGFGASHFGRRYLALISPGGVVITPAKVLASVDNGNGTETVTVDVTLPVNFGPGVGSVSFLTYVRLANDAATYQWLTSDVVRVELATAEIPLEAPSF